MSDAARPPHLSEHNAAAFQLSDVVGHYHLRTPYPSTLAGFLLGLTQPRGGAVLELGCGTGEIARSLAPLVERIDAIDISSSMVGRAQEMRGGDHPAIHWIIDAAESAPIAGPYALAVAGDSLHWMDWGIVLPRINKHLAPSGVLAIVHAVMPEPPWASEISALFARYSVIRDHEPFDLIAALESRGLFARTATRTLEPEPFTRTLDEYIDALHATAGLPRERMGAAAAAAFDDEVRTLVAPHVRGGILELGASAEVAWGTPLAPSP